MTDKERKLAVGCLLHDFGKLTEQDIAGKSHSITGWEHLKEFPVIGDTPEILDCILYHHADMLREAEVPDDALCYVTYMADNIASASDRRRKSPPEDGTVRNTALESVFNILNRNHDLHTFKPCVAGQDSDINYPAADADTEHNAAYYTAAVNGISAVLSDFALDDEHIDSLLNVLEQYLSYVPSAAQTNELADIPMYDHLKLTAALGLCIEQYLQENDITDYKKELFTHSAEFYDKRVFMLYKLELNGAEDFIFDIVNKDALHNMRSRALYTDILMRSITDELLNRLSLCRANVLSYDGNAAYIIMPAAETAETAVKQFETELKQWFLAEFGIRLSMSSGYAYCSASEFHDDPEGSYAEIFRSIEQMITDNNKRRYTAEDIAALNAAKEYDPAEECRICHRYDADIHDGMCSFCASLLDMPDVSDEDDCCAIVKDSVQRDGIALPFGNRLLILSKPDMDALRQQNENDYVRMYSLNSMGHTADICINDYARYTDLHDYVQHCTGTDKLGALSISIDNMDKVYTDGFRGDADYETISRSAVLSRYISLYFRRYIRRLLQNGQFRLADMPDDADRSRNAAVVYSDAGSAFIIGAWSDVLCFAVDLHNSFRRFTQGTLTLSAGFGMFSEYCPVYTMYSETQRLLAAGRKQLNSGVVACLNAQNAYIWDDFISNTVLEKLAAVEEYTMKSSQHGITAVHNLLDLINGAEQGSRINIARLSYFIARLQPAASAETRNTEEFREQVQNYRKFSVNLFSWIKDADERKKLRTALYLSIYLHQGRLKEA